MSQPLEPTKDGCPPEVQPEGAQYALSQNSGPWGPKAPPGGAMICPDLRGPVTPIRGGE